MKFLLNPQTPRGTKVTFESNIAAHQYHPSKSGGELVIKIKKEAYSLRQFLVLVREIIQVAKTHHIKELVIEGYLLAKLAPKNIKDQELALLVSENMVTAGYQFSFYKKKEKERRL